MLLGGIGIIALAAGIFIALGTVGSVGWAFAGVTLGAALGCFVLLVGGVFLWLLWECHRVDLDVPQEEDDPHYRRIFKLIAPAVCTIVLTRITTKGMDQKLPEGRFLLVCNHCNEMDPVILLKYFPDSQLAFISKRENATMFMVGKLMHKIQCQLINRENDREALKTIIRCINIIKEDKASIAVFPEGYINDDHKLHHFRSGVFKIAQKAGVPIVVCTLRDTQYIFDNAKHLKPTHVELHLLGVIPAEELVGVSTVDIGDRVYRMMADDLGPEHVAQE